MKLLFPEHWQDYELLDCGDFEKLERFGPYVLRRPEPQAIWKKVWDEVEWQKRAQAGFEQKGSHSGEWIRKKVPDNWQINYSYKDMRLRFKLALTAFKHVGIFPEQAVNWDFIYNACRDSKGQPSVLNLFAYTGGASLAAKAAGADVVHVDSVRQVIAWARENMELSGLNDIRWTLEDAHRFVKRELKRGKKYNGIILDPPAYGIGAKGERWKLEDSLDEMLRDLSELLNPKAHFFILNLYSLGLSALVVENLLDMHFPHAINKESGELYLPSKSGFKLPLGVFGRFRG